MKPTANATSLDPAKPHGKNPLAQAFGMVLRSLRDEMGLNSADLAGALHLNASSYRLVEAGIAPLQPRYSLALVKKLMRLEWNRVAQFLVAIELVGVNLSRGEVRDRVTEIGYLDSDLGELLLKFEVIWPAFKKGVESGEISKLLLDANVIDALRKYLTEDTVQTPIATVQNVPAYFIEAASKTPPLYLDIISQQMTLSHLFPPLITPKGLGDWEKQNVNRLQRIYGVVTNADILPESVNKQIDWSFLWNREFEAVMIISLDQRQKPAAVFGKISRALAEVHRNVGTIAEHLKKKLIIVHPERHIVENIESELKKESDNSHTSCGGNDTHPTERAIRNLWLYRIAKTHGIAGFADCAGPGGLDAGHLDLAVMLSTEASNNWTSILEEYLAPQLREANLTPYFQNKA